MNELPKADGVHRRPTSPMVSADERSASVRPLRRPGAVRRAAGVHFAFVNLRPGCMDDQDGSAISDIEGGRCTHGRGLRGSAMGMISLLGNLGAFVGPYTVGYINEKTGSFSSGMLLLVASLGIAAVLATRIRVVGKRKGVEAQWYGKAG